MGIVTEVDLVPLPNEPWAYSYVPRGWVGSVNTITAALTNVAPGFKVVQIKQKFGSLRYYYELPDDVSGETAAEVAEMVRAVEDAALTRCEICGAAGRLRKENPYWWRTLCDEHEGSREEVNVPLRVRGDSDE